MTRMAARKPSPATPAPALVAKLDAGVPPVVVLAGGERWFREEGVREIVARCLPDGDPGASFLRVDAKRVEDRSEVSAAIDELRSASLFGGGKVVAIDNPEAAAGPWVSGRASPITTLAKAALATPVPGSTLVLVTTRPCRGSSPAPVATLVKAGALVVDCRPLYDAPASWQRGAAPHEHELAAFVARRMSEVHGKRLSRVDAHAITRLVGSDLGSLDTSLRTLALYVGDGTTVGPEEIHAALGRTRNDPSWRLTDAVADGDAARAFELLEAAFARGVPDGRGAVVSNPDALFGFVGAALFSTWRRLLAGAEALALGEDAAGAARAQGVPPFKVDAFLDQCRRRDPADLLARSGAFLEAELGVKGGTTPARVALERLVARLTAPAEGVGGRP